MKLDLNIPDLSGLTVREYRIERQIAHGGMGEVYLAFHTRLEVLRAIKRIRSDASGEERERLIVRFEKEGKRLAKLKHPSIVPVNEAFEEGGNLFIVMDFVEGKTLKQMIQETGSLDEKTVYACANSISSALAHAHSKGVVHRDISPDNIMRTATGAFVLMDFGVATDKSEASMTGAYIVGKPGYMAPEQIDDSLGEITGKSDLYALAIVLFHGLTGRPLFPHKESPYQELVQRINSYEANIDRWLEPVSNPRLRAVLKRATAVHPSDRYDDVLTFSAEFRRSVITLDHPKDTLATFSQRSIPLIAAFVLMCIVSGGYLALRSSTDIFSPPETVEPGFRPSTPGFWNSVRPDVSG